MKILKFLIISSLISVGVAQDVRSQSPCKEIKATAEVRNTTDLRNDGSVTVTIQGNSSKFRIFLIAPKKADNRLDLPVEEIKNLTPGNYELVITDTKEGDFCPKRIQVAVK